MVESINITAIGRWLKSKSFHYLTIMVIYFKESKMSEKPKFQIGDIFYFPVEVLKNNDYRSFIITLTKGPNIFEKVNFRPLSDKLDDAILIERDGKHVPAPGNLVELNIPTKELETGIIIGFDTADAAYPYDYKILKINKKVYSMWYKGEIYTINQSDIKVIGRNGELLPEKHSENNKTELLGKCLWIIDKLLVTADEPTKDFMRVIEEIKKAASEEKI